MLWEARGARGQWVSYLNRQVYGDLSVGGEFRDRVPEVSYLNIGLYADPCVKVGFRDWRLN